ncbi:MAG: hypothetical protein QM811_12375 [Pirellulales bacterium]
MGLFALATFGMVVVLQERIDQRWSIPFGLVMLGAFLTTIPVIVSPVSRFVKWVLPISGDLEKRLARQQLLRRRTRTVLTAGVLTVAMTSGIGSGNTVVNQIQDVKDWYKRTFAGDYFVTVNAIGDTDDKRNKAVDVIEAGIRATPGVTHVETTHLQQGAAAGSAAMIVVRSAKTADDFPLQIEQGEIDDAFARWKAGECVVGTVLAKRANLSLNQEIVVETSGKSHRLKIAGIAGLCRRRTLRVPGSRGRQTALRNRRGRHLPHRRERRECRNRRGRRHCDRATRHRRSERFGVSIVCPNQKENGRAA